MGGSQNLARDGRLGRSRRSICSIMLLSIVGIVQLLPQPGCSTPVAQSDAAGLLPRPRFTSYITKTPRRRSSKKQQLSQDLHQKLLQQLIRSPGWQRAGASPERLAFAAPTEALARRCHKRQHQQHTNQQYYLYQHQPQQQTRSNWLFLLLFQSDAAAALASMVVASMLWLCIFPTASAKAYTASSWFAAPTGPSSQKFSSRNSAPDGQEVTTNFLENIFNKKLQGDEIFDPPKSLMLPYTRIRDNTTGAAAFADILDLLPTGPRDSASSASGGNPRILLDVGAGKSNAAKLFLESAKPGWRYVAADPYNRSEEENSTAQRAVEDAGGADAVCSMSVLNVIAEKASRIEHIRLCHDALRQSGLAFFKVWAGYWPERGSSVPSVQADKDIYQSNSWASAFKEEVEQVFGAGKAYVDNNLNLIVAKS
eukprot:TRINITY_DN16902_c0_g1_i1.p1 TRINITY_DN16902_c0_g1~~TRINITY_DN16902_c0_g1_i1.p1  ORF type:complete len:425 (-),score=73.02 TRINITY_DN16902_c0_g1_i1:17-1291(-)